MIIVTGGAGLIGSSMVWQLNRAGIDDILIVDHLGNTTDKWKNLAPLRYDDYLERDKFQEKLLRGDFNGANIEGIYHFGACSATTERDATYLVENNFRYTAMLAEFCIPRNIRMLYASSCATYGDGSCGYKDDENTIENLRPLNMYGYSKQMFDLYARRRGWLEQLVGCKFSNVYGPNERHKADMRSVVLRCYEQITSCGRMKLFKSYRKEYADGEQLRDFLYVKDAVRMIWYIFNKSSAAGLFNIGSGIAESWNHLVTAAFNALKKPVNIEYIDMPESLRDRYQYYTCASIEKLRKLGYSEKVMSLDEAVADYICNYLERGLYLGDE